MTDAVFGFIGLGLIGGSLAKGIRRACPDAVLMAFSRTREPLLQAQKDGVIDLVLDSVNEQFSRCDIIYLCTPVEYNAVYLAQLRPLLKPGAIVTDVGSTKTAIHEAAAALSMEGCFIGGHPMAGSEKTGYEHSTDHLLENAYYVITPSRGSRQTDIERLTTAAKAVGSIPIVLDYEEHDRVTAAISHLPHIIASSLVNLIREQDGAEEYRKRLAAGGFKDITRIASSSPEMWEQICMTNAGPIASVLEAYIDSLKTILSQVKQKDGQKLHQLFDTSRTYRNSISDAHKGSVTPEYSFTMDVVDEPGAISTIAVILSARGISISNIGINHNREQGEGALKIAFYDEASMQAAWTQLKKYNYELIKSQ